MLLFYLIRTFNHIHLCSAILADNILAGNLGEFYRLIAFYHMQNTNFEGGKEVEVGATSKYYMILISGYQKAKNLTPTLK